VSIKYRNWRFVDGKELYNVEEDRGQNVNVFNDHPKLVRELTKIYESFWNTLPPQEDLISAHILGAAEAPSVRLNAMDWYIGDAPWTQQSLVQKTSQGKWLIEIARDGRYRFELRRYPQEASKAIEATSAAIEIGVSQSQTVLEFKDKKALLELDLKKGTYNMQTFFRDDKITDRDQTWGANYVYVNYLD